MRASHSIMAAHLGGRLKQIRGKRKQGDFASRLGINQSQYSRYELGRRLPPDAVILKVAKECGIKPEQVIWGENYAPPPAKPTAISELIDSLSQMVRLLDAANLEELYLFLKIKSETSHRARQDLLKSAGEALLRIRKETRPG